MALTNQQRVGKALDILREGLGDFVAREFQSRFGAKAQAAAKDRLVTERLRGNKPIQEVKWRRRERITERRRNKTSRRRATDGSPSHLRLVADARS